MNSQDRRRIRRERQRTIDASIAKADALYRGTAEGSNYDRTKGVKMTRKVKRDNVDFGGHELHVRMEFSTHSQRHQSKFGLSGRTKQYQKERVAVDPKQGSRYIRN